jgi:hypothetical protein
MTNYRIARVDNFVSSSQWQSLGNNTTGSLSKAWGVMVPYGSTTTGNVSLNGGADLYLNQLIPGQIYPCYPTAIRVSSGTGSVLS